MREAMEMPEMNVRAKMAGEIIRDLCQAGHGDEAWKMVDPAKGQVRDLELMAYFRYAGLSPMQVLERAGELPDMAEVRRALDGYLSAGTLQDVHDVMSMPGFADKLKKLEAGYPPEMKPVVVELVRERLRTARSDAEREAVAVFARKMYDLKAITSSQWVEVVKMNDLRNAFERWEEIRAVTEAEGVLQEGDPHRSGMLQKLVGEDPLRAMSVLKERDDRQGRADFADAVRSWYERDMPECTRWLAEHSAELSPGQRDALYAALAKAATAQGDAAEAKKWAAKVEDAEIRKGLGAE
ncbi:MAG: hypothetical protein EOP87_11185 [Verrucomicrobiaceae bacterium]|nr:MAG: hypothetical protein EOP87_11185 [Verrucomicrobiaceae bacterium]